MKSFTRNQQGYQ